MVVSIDLCRESLLKVCAPGGSQTLQSVLNPIYDRLHSSKENKSLLKKHFKREIMIPIVDLATPTFDSNLGHCIFTAMCYHDCVIGVNAPDPEAYNVMGLLFNAIIKDYHKLNPKAEIHHPASYFGSVTDFDSSDLDPEGQYIVSTKVQINRNLQGYGFANILTPEIRVELEAKSKEALMTLTGDLEGSYYPVDSLCTEMRDELTKKNMLFDDSDKYLKVNGVFRDWPNYRGMYINNSKTFVTWVNEQDHLTLISTQEGTDIGKAYQQTVNALKILERKLTFVKDDRLGYLTYWPSNVGTGLHAIFHLKIPHLAAKKNFNAICDKLNLTAESLQKTPDEGEDCDQAVTNKVPMEGVDIVHAVANKCTIGITEVEVMRATLSSVKELIKMEKDAAEGKGGKCVVS